MKKLFILLSLVVLAAAGSAFAQTDQPLTDQPTTDQPTATAPSPSDTQAPPSDSGSQPATAPSSASAGSTSPDSAPPSQSGTLPATASDSPLLMAIGVAALAAFTGLLVFRKRRRVAHS